MKKDFWLIGIFVTAISFASKTFVDATTYPKLVALTLLLIGSVIFQVFKKKNNGIFLALLTWNLIFFLFLSFYGFDQAKNVLLGHPGRNLGLLSLLIGILTFYFYRNLHIATSLTLLLISSSIISASYLLAKIIQDPPLLLSQFSYPEPNALNQNILTLFISFGVVSGLALLYAKPRVGVMHPNLIIAQNALCSIALWRIGDLQAKIYLIIIIFVTLSITLIKSGYLRKFVMAIPYIGAPAVLLLAIHNIDFLREKLGLTVFERLEIASITLKYTIRHPFSFRLPDTTADLHERTSIQGIDQYLDNAHNVFLELGIHLGWVPMLFALLSIVAIFTFKTIQINNSLLPKGVKVYSISCLLITHMALYLTILHPITILAVAISLSGIFNLKVGQKTNSALNISFFKAKSKSHYRLTELLSKLQLPSKVRNVGSVFLLLVPLILITEDVRQKIAFRHMEIRLISGSIESELGVRELTSMSLRMKDRQYLNYTGIQLAELGACKKMSEILLVQENLKISDFPSSLLRQWHGINCPYQ